MDTITAPSAICARIRWVLDGIRKSPKIRAPLIIGGDNNDYLVQLTGYVGHDTLSGRFWDQGFLVVRVGVDCNLGHYVKIRELAE
jgi:hypothetical protein